MKVLITGGGGFIGSHLTDALLARGHAVRLLDNLDPQVHGQGTELPAYLNAGAEFVRGDVRDRESVDRALEGVDAVIHNAAATGTGQSMYAIRHYMDVNVVGTAVLLEAMTARRGQFKRLVVPSSMAVYGEGLYRTADGRRAAPPLRTSLEFKQGSWEPLDPENGKPLASARTDEEKPQQPISPYGISKKSQEELCLTVGRAYGIPTVALRYFNVYGERQSLSNPYTGIAAIFASRLLNDRAPMIFEDGLQSRDFVHVSDIVQANLLALTKDEMVGDSFNVGTGQPVTVIGVAEAVAAALGKQHLKPEVDYKFRDGYVRHCYSDISKIRRVAGYEPKVSFEKGVQALVRWCGEAQATGRGAQQSETKFAAAIEELNTKGPSVLSLAGGGRRS